MILLAISPVCIMWVVGPVLLRGGFTSYLPAEVFSSGVFSTGSSKHQPSNNHVSRAACVAVAKALWEPLGLATSQSSMGWDQGLACIGSFWRASIQRQSQGEMAFRAGSQQHGHCCTRDCGTVAGGRMCIASQACTTPKCGHCHAMVKARSAPPQTTSHHHRGRCLPACADA